MISERYSRGPSWWPLSVLWGEWRRPRVRRLALLWVAAGAVGVGGAVLEASLGWSGLPLAIGGVTVGVTIYPPLLATVLLAVWLGPVWGAVPAYLATLVSALMSGMEPAVAGLFAFATPLELLLIWGSMVILDIHPDLPEARDLGLFLLVGLIAATASSLATLIWNQTRALDLVTGQRVWQGWLIGDLAQLWLLTPPLLHWLGAPARRWIDRQIGVPPRQRISYTRSVVVLLVALGMLGALVFQGVGMAIETLGAAEGLVRPGGEPLLERFGEIGLFLGLLFGVTLLTTFLFTSALARMGERARRESLRDMLTGCYNRRAFPDLFQRESERSRRLGQGIAIVFFDVDRFKEINDAYGHEVGDRLLRLLPYRVRGVMREHDLLFRWGGEEFVAVLPHTSPGDAARLADRIRKAVAEQPLVTEYVPRPISVTVSVGAAGAREYPVDPDRLIAAADAACLRAKREGRDRVVAAGDDPQSGRPSPAVPHAIP